MTVELPPGVLLSQTASASAAAYQILRRHPEVLSVVESIGEDDDGEVRSGNLYVQLVKPNQRKLQPEAVRGGRQQGVARYPGRARDLPEPGGRRRRAT